VEQNIKKWKLQICYSKIPEGTPTLSAQLFLKLSNLLYISVKYISIFFYLIFVGHRNYMYP
jgi:hypothetical protein